MIGRTIPQHLAGIIVHPILNILYLTCRIILYSVAFGNKPADDGVGVLIRPAFPAGIGMAIVKPRALALSSAGSYRSEELRVGKEYRSRWSPYD